MIPNQLEIVFTTCLNTQKGIFEGSVVTDLLLLWLVSMPGSISIEDQNMARAMGARNFSTLVILDTEHCWEEITFGLWRDCNYKHASCRCSTSTMRTEKAELTHLKMLALLLTYCISSVKYELTRRHHFVAAELRLEYHLLREWCPYSLHSPFLSLRLCHR